VGEYPFAVVYISGEGFALSVTVSVIFNPWFLGWGDVMVSK
jgi:hypothetical protein